MFTQIFFGATGKKMHMPMLSFLGEIFPTSFMLLIQALIKSTTTLITKMTLQVTFFKNSIFSKLLILHTSTLPKYQGPAIVVRYMYLLCQKRQLRKFRISIQQFYFVGFRSKTIDMSNRNLIAHVYCLASKPHKFFNIA